jgi:membrane-bound lytic murein transglycosylase A
MILRLLSVFALSVVLSACVRPGPIQVPTLPPEQVAKAKKDYHRPLPAGQHALRKITDPAALPDLAAGFQDREGLLAGVERSLHYLGKPSSEQFFPVSGISHAQVVRSLELFRELLQRGGDALELAAEVRERFDVYTTIGCDDQGTVLFTGYYTPVFDASREPSAEFSHALHAPPEGHVKDLITGKTLGLRRADGTIDPDYPGREELLSSDRLKGRELVYLRNPFEAYIVGVQGSAQLRLRDGTKLEVGYAGTNGKPYASLGRALVKAGKLKPDELNLKRMIDYFSEHPEDFAPLAAKNQRYVYFQESSGGPFGCLNEQVTRLRTIATDKSIFPRASLCFLEARLPVAAGVYRGFTLDQDAGGAIRAPGRCDVYMGTGEAAGREAGRTLAEGRMYYLIARDEELFAYGK